MSSPLSALLFLPAVGALLVLLLPARRRDWIRAASLAFTLATLLLAAWLWAGFDPRASGYQYQERALWIPGIPVYYHLGVDGLSLPLVFLTPLLGLAALLYTLRWQDPGKAFHVLFLLMLTGLLGVFVALDLFVFFLFWEVSLIPMYFLISVWGEPTGRRRAAYKFFVYTLVGSIAMLLVIQLLLVAHGTLDIPELARLKPFSGEPRLAFATNETLRLLAFLGFFLAFAIKVPVWPFHTWMPEAYVTAPPAVTAMLSGVMAKMGVYAFLRISLPLFPDVSAALAPWVALLALLNIVYGALVALAQRDGKALLAWSSFNHMGFMVLGVMAGAAALGTPDRALALNGAVLQMFNHGLTTGALFLLLGMMEARLGTRLIPQLGGYANRMPVFFGILLTTAMSSLGLPGLNNFWGEFLIVRGAWAAFPLLTALSLLGILLTAVFLLALVRSFFHGPTAQEPEALPDLDRRELAAVVPLLVLMVAIGLFPALFLSTSQGSVLELISQLLA